MGLINLVGHRYGRLTVLRYSHTLKEASWWVCVCDCGNEKTIRSNSLRTNNTTSCGCLHKEKLVENSTKHGFSKERLYRTWIDIKSRCFSPNTGYYSEYGGRGITMCAEWREDFVAFREWAMSNGYRDDLTIERLDVDGGYAPHNCTWIPMSSQSINRRATRFVDFRDLTMTAIEFSKAFQINHHAVLRGINRGWTADRIIIHADWRLDRYYGRR